MSICLRFFAACRIGALCFALSHSVCSPLFGQTLPIEQLGLQRPDVVGALLNEDYASIPDTPDDRVYIGAFARAMAELCNREWGESWVVPLVRAWPRYLGVDMVVEPPFDNIFNPEMFRRLPDILFDTEGGFNDGLLFFRSVGCSSSFAALMRRSIVTMILDRQRSEPTRPTRPARLMGAEDHAGEPVEEGGLSDEELRTLETRLSDASPNHSVTVRLERNGTRYLHRGQTYQPLTMYIDAHPNIPEHRSFLLCVFDQAIRVSLYNDDLNQSDRDAANDRFQRFVSGFADLLVWFDEFVAYADGDPLTESLLSESWEVSGSFRGGSSLSGNGLEQFFGYVALVRLNGDIELETINNDFNIRLFYNASGHTLGGFVFRNERLIAETTGLWDMTERPVYSRNVCDWDGLR